MCGISGMFLFHQPVDAAALARMGKSLSHRGPDTFATLIIGQVGLAHNRLSIVDITPTGDQPIQDDCHFLIYNGEIYNHKELRANLESQGVTFRGTSDTETLFECLKKYGVEQTLRLIRGMYAFAYYDLINHQLFLCRDRFGIKPLYWMCTPKGLFWASEIKALMVEPGVKIEPIRALFSITGSGDQSNKHTIFEDVFHVPPGNYLVIDANHQPEIKEYYSILDDIDENYYNELASQSEQQVTATFDLLLCLSVERMLMSDVPVGIFASGGLDSNLISAISSRLKPDINLFTSDIAGKLSELPYSTLLSETIHAPLMVSRFSPEQFLCDLAAATYHYETPIVKFANAIPFARVAELAHQHGVKPVLTGEGSDELFLGYPALHYKKYQKILDYPKKLIDAIYSLIPVINKYVKKSNDGKINDFIALLASGFERQTMRERGGLAAYHFLNNSDRQKDHYQAIQMIREHLIALLHRNDRMGMQHSIESRFPFLDEGVVKFGVNLPLKWKIRRVNRIFDKKHPFIMDKAIVRLTAQKYLPEKLANKPKWGFGIYSHRNMKVNPEYFSKGYLADLLHLDDRVFGYITDTQDRFMTASLVSLDIFGRIFDWKEPLQSITERNLKFIQMVVN